MNGYQQDSPIQSHRRTCCHQTRTPCYASIARRIQDPLAELVKIDPKSIGVGQYQHDMNRCVYETGEEQVKDAFDNPALIKNKEVTGETAFVTAKMKEETDLEKAKQLSGIKQMIRVD